MSLPWRKTFFVFAGSVAVGAATYYTYRQMRGLLTRKKKEVEEEEEAVEDGDRIRVTTCKKVLVLGLEGSGKTSLLTSMTHGNVETPPVPTSGFNVTQSELVKISKSQVPEKVSLNLWEVGGNEKFRKYWSNFYSNTDCLLFLIDPTDVDQIGDAAEELARAAGDYRLGAVPLVVVATKQDLPSSRMDLNVLRRTLIEIGISPQILCRMTAVATPVSQDADGQEPNKGVQELKDLLSRLLEITH